jgi:cyclopropane fatty-acyl-phospholipid synthase-like methyltransferase
LLNHGITTQPLALQLERSGVVGGLLWREGSFIARSVFPDAELLPLGAIVHESERVGFETADVETLRRHYARTLQLWGERLTKQRDAAVKLVGDETYRLWELYLAGCARAFASGRINVAQVLLAKPGSEVRSALPMTRADLYALLVAKQGVERSERALRQPFDPLQERVDVDED